MIEFLEPHEGAIPLQSSSSEVVISSSPPILSNLVFSPTEPTTLSDLSVVFDLEDPDGDTNLTMDYTWFVNDVLILSENDVESISSLTENSFVKGDVVSIEITPKDFSATGETSSATVVIGNTTPTTPNISITPTVAVGGVDNIYCSYEASIDQDATDGEDVLIYTQVWVDENNTEYESDMISSSETEEDQVWTCRVTVSDGTENIIGESSITIASPCPLGSCTENTEVTTENGQVLDVTFKYILGGTEPLGIYQLPDFYMMETEVTQKFYDEVVGIDPANPPSIEGDDYPIDNVNWHNLAYLANRVTQLYNASYGTALQECYACTDFENCEMIMILEDIYMCTGFRLPTEWEWEYAARSGTPRDIWTGYTPELGAYIPNASNVTILEHSDTNLEIDISEYVHTCKTSGTVTPTQTVVASLLPNGFGLYDMHGNVAEWTHELTGAPSDYSPTRPSLNYDFPFTYPLYTPNYSIIRGGRCNDDQIHMGAGKRKTWTATSNRKLSGGRLVRGALQQ